jgi:hypothetical protein
MFEQVTILLSFVYATALTHLLSSASELVLARSRVRISGLYILWMANALLILLVNWLGFWGLHGVRQWTVSLVLSQFLLAFVQYFTCSTLLIRPRDEERIDLVALFEERRDMVASAFAGLCVTAMAINYVDRNIYFGQTPSNWIMPDITLGAALPLIVLAGWARARWARWLGGLAVFAAGIQFLVAYSISG